MRNLTGMFGLLLLLTSGLTWAKEDAALFKACPGLAAWAKTHPHGGSASAAGSAGQRKITVPALRRELAERAAADQHVRAPLVSGTQQKATIQSMLAVDADNLAWLKGIINRRGFPSPAMVGNQGVADAWLLVQHADRDPVLQSAVLKVLKARLDTGGVRKADLALLTDSVLLAQGKPQRYASQFDRTPDGRFVLKPTEDMTNVDLRRAAMDLMPLGTYRCLLKSSYGGMPVSGR